ncbi:Transcription factor, K-box [Dillenia turbinata]|uniref:Transcription factor, K-box n=1 Tax=Dillenia turbinata TaxID=194707 RepID=A0AAN8Z2W5_9MAGN
MGRGKIEIKKIENPTNRQVTYSKRRNGIFKKAQELTVLCDATISLIMISNNQKLHEYTSPNTTTKKVYDMYQRAMGVDLWHSHYEKMQENLKKLKKINDKLRSDIRHRMGEDLDDLSIGELKSLQQNMIEAKEKIRVRRVKSLEQEAKMEDPYGLVDNGEDYESAVAFVNGPGNNCSYRLHHENVHQAGYGIQDLRLS